MTNWFFFSLCIIMSLMCLAKVSKRKGCNFHLKKCTFHHKRTLFILFKKIWGWGMLMVINMDLSISNSLIINEENTKEINTETEFGYVMKHLHKIKPTFISIFSLNTDLFEMLDQTLGRVFHQDSQTPRSC